MKKFSCFFAFGILAFATFSVPAVADAAADSLSNCLADNTTGKDRKDLAQWVFVAMSEHPQIKPFSNITEASRDELDKKLAALATRLMTESCNAETRSAMQSGGGAAIGAAFEVLGQLAMNELMSNPAVSESFVRYAKYLDQSKFEAAFK